MAHIIAVSGKMGSGKDTTYEILRKDIGAKRLAFADKLKEVAKTYFPFCDIETKDEVTRSTLQGLGQFARDYISKDFWVDILLEELRDYDEDEVVVITDLRYKNEYEELLLLSPEHDVTFIRLNGRSNGGSVHPSEIELDTVNFRNTYDNSGSKEDLRNYLKWVLHELYSEQ